MANGTPSPGWYQDPRDPSQVRWWDGGRWTQNTQQMPGAPAAEQPAVPTPPEVQPPTPEVAQPSVQQPAAADPWTVASQQPEQQWGQAPAQSGEQQWGQAPAQPGEQQWGQAPAQPGEQQWGQAPAQPGEQQWGQAPAQSGEQQWGQAPAQSGEQQWGQAPVQPGEQQWGQAPVQPGGWQQAAPGAAWGSTVAPGPVPGGLAPGSPMGQTNVFPTAEAVDPITGMPVTQPDSGSKTSGKRLAALVLGTLLVGVLILGLLWFFLFRDPGTGGSGTSTGPIEVTATFSGTVDPACADLGDALTADQLSSTVAQRLKEVAVAKNLEENQAYFEQLGKDIKPIMDQYQSTCIAAVSAGGAPEFYRTFVETFQSSVTDGEAVATAALSNGGQVPAEDTARLQAEADKLQVSSDAVVAISGGSSEPSASPSESAAPSTSSAPSASDSAVPSPIG